MAKTNDTGDLLADPTLVAAVVKRGVVIHGAGLTASPGETVHLPADEVAALRARGVLEDPDAAPIATGAGPSFGGDADVTVGAA